MKMVNISAVLWAFRNCLWIQSRIFKLMPTGISLIMATLLLIGCSDTKMQRTSNKYFPTNPGKQWIYVNPMNQGDSVFIDVIDSVKVQGRWFAVFEESYKSGDSLISSILRGYSVDGGHAVLVVACTKGPDGVIEALGRTISLRYDFAAPKDSSWLTSPATIGHGSETIDAQPGRTRVVSERDSVPTQSNWLINCYHFETQTGGLVFDEWFAPNVGLVARGRGKMFLLKSH